MMINDIAWLLFALSIGIVLGVFFFGGLWWTVRKGLCSNHAWLWFQGSLLFRTSLCLAGFYFIGSDHPERLLVCLAGFIVARMVIIRLTTTADKPAPPSIGEKDNVV